MKLAGFYLLSILMTQMHFVWGDSDESDYVRQVPQEISSRVDDRWGVAAEISALFNYSSHCEKDGYYEYQIQDQEIVIDSYKEVQKNGICLQKNTSQVRVNFEINDLEKNKLYHVYFLNSQGEPEYVGDLRTGVKDVQERLR